VLLMDEPTGSIDPVATAQIEGLMVALREEHAVGVIAYSMRRAPLVAGRVVYFHLRALRAVSPTDLMFTRAFGADALAVVAGKFG
jgi:phosphate transport system ATP-binding protein